MKSAHRSAISIVVTWVLARTTSGMMEASATRRRVLPWTRQNWSTTAMGSDAGPILHVPEIVIRGRHIVQQPTVQRLIRGQVSVGRGNASGDDLLIGRILQQPGTQTHGLSQPLPVPGVLQVAVVHSGRHVRVGRGQPQLTGSAGQVETDANAVARIFPAGID